MSRNYITILVVGLTIAWSSVGRAEDKDKKSSPKKSPDKPSFFKGEKPKPSPRARAPKEDKEVEELIEQWSQMRAHQMRERMNRAAADHPPVRPDGQRPAGPPPQFQRPFGGPGGMPHHGFAGGDHHGEMKAFKPSDAGGREFRLNGHTVVSSHGSSRHHHGHQGHHGYPGHHHPQMAFMAPMHHGGMYYHGGPGFGYGHSHGGNPWSHGSLAMHGWPGHYGNMSYYGIQHAYFPWWREFQMPAPYGYQAWSHGPSYAHHAYAGMHGHSAHHGGRSFHASPGKGAAYGYAGWKHHDHHGSRDGKHDDKDGDDDHDGHHHRHHHHDD